MKYAALFVVTTVVTWLLMELVSTQQRRCSISLARTLVMPAILAAVLVGALLFFNLNLNGKAI